MDAISWFHIVTAVLAANAISLMFVAAASHMFRHEKRTGTSFGASSWVYLGLAIPPGLIAFGGYLLKV